MMAFNKVILVGRLTYDPELRYTTQGTMLTRLVVAVDRSWEKGEADFIPIIAFGKRAEIVTDYRSKGSKVLVEGRLRQRRWQTETGEKRSVIEVVADNIQFLDNRKQTAAMSGKTSNAPDLVGESEEEALDELPF